MEKSSQKSISGFNIKTIRELRSISQSDLADAVGVSRQTIVAWESRRSIRVNKSTADVLTKTLHVELKELMEEEVENAVSPDEGLIPFYDTMAIGGKQIVTDDTAVMANQYEMIRPGHFFGKATGAMRLYGDSMYEKYPSGSIIAFRDAGLWRDFLHFGQDYMIETEDGHRVVKTVMATDSSDTILAVSHNTFKNKHGIDIYRPYPIPKALIRRMAYVLGIIKFEASI